MSIRPSRRYRRAARSSRPTSGLRCVFEQDGDRIAVLTDESGFVLTLANFDKVDKVEYPGAFHIGFMQESRERVDEDLPASDVRRHRREAAPRLPRGLDLLPPRTGRHHGQKSDTSITEMEIAAGAGSSARAAGVRLRHPGTYAKKVSKWASRYLDIL